MAKQYINPGPLTFTAVIRENMTTGSYINFPYDLKETFGYGNLVPFKAIFDDRIHYQGSLAKMGGPQAMILLRNDVAAQLGKQPGQAVEVVLELDDKPREVAVPEDAKAALQEAGLYDAFERLAYTHRKEYVTWIEEAKKPETRLSRIAKMLDMIAAKTSK